jgi:hypothetical protein
MVSASISTGGLPSDVRAPDGLPRACSLVLEGGVTSAVVYAGLIAGLSKRFTRFEKLGGTSAGAVAAAIAALAERARRSGAGDAAFEAVDRLPADLASEDGNEGATVLRRLFQPQRGTRRAFAILQAGLQAWHPQRGLGPVIRAVLWQVLRQHGLVGLAGALPGVAVASMPWWTHGATATGAAAALLLGLLVAVAGAVLAVATSALLGTALALRANHFGLCTGMPASGDANDDSAVTTFLHTRFKRLIGLDKPDQPPALFAHLWGNGKPDDHIDLQVITSAVTLGRPMRLPNDPGVDALASFCFDRAEWETFFPADVLDWMQAHQRRDLQPLPPTREGRVLTRFPPPAQLPIVVAVRLSLSFPVLFSAVPMYLLERVPEPCHADAPGDTDPRYAVRKVYFSDGGITSNCPVQLFDRPLPTHPTFAADLREIARGPVAPACRRVWIDGDDRVPPLQVTDPQVRSWFKALVDFAGDLIGTAMNWRDNIQRELPGYAERVINIGLTSSQGGLNLAMTSPTIKQLGELGRAGAQRLAEAYQGPSAGALDNQWDRHRWLRLRSTLAALATYADEFEAGRIRCPPPGYEQLIRGVPPQRERLADAAAVEEALRLLGQMRELTAHDAAVRLDENAPRPRPRLRMSHPW